MLFQESYLGDYKAPPLWEIQLCMELFQCGRFRKPNK